MTGTLARYFALRFLVAFISVLGGVFGLIMLIDYVELMRRHSDIPNVSAWMVAKASFVNATGRANNRFKAQFRGLIDNVRPDDDASAEAAVEAKHRKAYRKQKRNRY